MENSTLVKKLEEGIRKQCVFPNYKSFLIFVTFDMVISQLKTGD